MNERLLELVNELNLEPIVFSLTEKSPGPKWSPSEAFKIEKRYREFLYLHGCYPDEDIVPDEEVDVFWHYHMLDSIKYVEDCDALFGHYFHHFPYLGARGLKDEELLDDKYKRTIFLLGHLFPDSTEYNSSRSSAICGGGGGGGGRCGGRVVGTNIIRPKVSFEYSPQRVSRVLFS